MFALFLAVYIPNVWPNDVNDWNELRDNHYFDREAFAHTHKRNTELIRWIAIRSRVGKKNQQRSEKEKLIKIHEHEKIVAFHKWRAYRYINHLSTENATTTQLP